MFDQLDNLLEESPTGDFLEIFANYSPTNDDSAYNEYCWAASFDFTGVSFFPEGYNSGGGCVAVSPRHVLSARHGGTWAAVGSEVVFIAADGTRHARVVLREQAVAHPEGLGNTDIGCAYLAGPDLPSTIAKYKLLPADHANRLPWMPDSAAPNPAARPPLVVLNQHLRAVVHEMRNWSYFYSPAAARSKIFHGSSLDFGETYTMSGNREFYKGHAIHGQDSGKPIFLRLGGELVLLGCHWYVTRFFSMAYCLDTINAAMAAQEAAVGETDGYQLQTIALGQPLRADRLQVHAAGALRSEIHAAGSLQNQTHAAGALRSEIHADGILKGQTHAAGSVRSQAA